MMMFRSRTPCLRDLAWKSIHEDVRPCVTVLVDSFGCGKCISLDGSLTVYRRISYPTHYTFAVTVYIDMDMCGAE